MTEAVYKILSAPKAIRAEITNIRIQLAGIGQSIFPSGIRYDTDKVSSSPNGDRMLQYIERIEKLQARAGELNVQYVSAQDRVVKECAALDPRESEVIMRRWIREERFEEIASAMHLSERQMFRIYREGIAKMSVNVSRQGVYNID